MLYDSVLQPDGDVVVAVTLPDNPPPRTVLKQNLTRMMWILVITFHTDNDRVTSGWSGWGRCCGGVFQNETILNLVVEKDRKQPSS